MQPFQKPNLLSVFLLFRMRRRSFWSVIKFLVTFCVEKFQQLQKNLTWGAKKKWFLYEHFRPQEKQDWSIICTKTLKWKMFAIHFITETRVVALMQSVTLHTPSTGSEPELGINLGFNFLFSAIYFPLMPFFFFQKMIYNNFQRWEFCSLMQVLVDYFTANSNSAFSL